VILLSDGENKNPVSMTIEYARGNARLSEFSFQEVIKSA